MVDTARRAYRFARRITGVKTPADFNPFPIDAWTDRAYATWFESNKAADAELEFQREASEGFALKPTFSFIVPLYKTPLNYLRVMADSVLCQTYGNLQLVLVNASPELPALASAVHALEIRDKRVSVVTLGDNLGITENTNAGIAVATGDFCCFLDHDDYIEPDLLFEYVKALNEDQEIDVLYCDEDLVEEDEKTGSFKHLHPLFKPQLSPELLLCKNNIVHLMTIRRTLVDSMPVPDNRYDGAQDYNMVLYATSVARKVHCIQKVLYHWRISAESTAANPDAKPYSQKSYRLSAQANLTRRKIEGCIVSSGIINIHNIWLSSTRKPGVCVVVDCAPWADEPEAEGACPFNTIDRFIEFFEQNNSHQNCRVLLVGCPDTKKRLPHGFERVECSDCLSVFGRFNLGAAAAGEEFLLFLDAGCFFDTPEPLEQLVGLCSLDGVGVSAPKTLYRGGRNKAYGVAVTIERIMPLYRGYEDDFPGYQCNLRALQNVSACGVQGLTVSRDLFEAVGGFDERFESEVGAADFCHRVLERGLRIAQTCTVTLRTSDVCPEHYFVSAENAPDFSESDIALFDEKWPGVREAGDPYYNVNLDQASGYCQVKRG